MSALTVGGGLVIAFTGLPAARWLGDHLDTQEFGFGDERLRGDLLKWLVTGVLIAYVIGVERESVRSLGATLPRKFPVGGMDQVTGLLAWWVSGVVATIVLSTIVYNLFRHYNLSTQDEFATDQATRPLPALLFTAVTAGVTESLLYQAYPIEHIAALSGSVIAAGFISWLVFTLGHYVSGRFSLQETAFTSAPALVVTVVYVLSGSVYAVIFVHGTLNVLSFLSQ